MVYITGTVKNPIWKFLKVMLIILILIGATAGYLYLHPETWKEWVKGTPLQPPPTITKTYKWKNESGEWQITGKPPPAGIKYETLIYSSDANIVPSVETPDTRE